MKSKNTSYYLTASVILFTSFISGYQMCETYGLLWGIAFSLTIPLIAAAVSYALLGLHKQSRKEYLEKIINENSVDEIKRKYRSPFSKLKTFWDEKKKRLW